MKLIRHAGASVVTTLLGGLLLWAIASPAAAQEVTVLCDYEVDWCEAMKIGMIANIVVGAAGCSENPRCTQGADALQTPGGSRIPRPFDYADQLHTTRANGILS